MVPKSRISQQNIRQQIQSQMVEPKFVLIDLKSGKRIELVHRQTVIGRNPNLMVNVQDISISSKHAMIDISPDFTKAYLVDLQPQNGSFLNNQRLDPAQRKRLHHNDLLQFGACPHKFKFVSTLLEKGEKDASDSDGEANVDMRREYMMPSKQHFREQDRPDPSSIPPTLRLLKDQPNSNQIPNYLPPRQNNFLNLEDRIQ